MGRASGHLKSTLSTSGIGGWTAPKDVSIEAPPPAPGRALPAAAAAGEAERTAHQLVPPSRSAPPRRTAGHERLLVHLPARTPTRPSSRDGGSLSPARQPLVNFSMRRRSSSGG